MLQMLLFGIHGVNTLIEGQTIKPKDYSNPRGNIRRPQINHIKYLYMVQSDNDHKNYDLMSSEPLWW